MQEGPPKNRPEEDEDGITRREFLKRAAALAGAAATAGAGGGYILEHMSSEGLKHPESIPPREKALASPEAFPFENFPWGVVGASRYEKHAKNDPEKVGVIRELLKSAFEFEVKRLGMFESRKEPGVSFPYTSLNLRELAEAIYTAQGGVLTEHGEERPSGPEEQKKEQVEFLFGSILGTTDASPFDFFEEPFHQIVKKLPRALQDLAAGREPDDFTIYTLSSPIHELGTMSPAFVAEMKKDPYRALGDVYAESVEHLALKPRKEDWRLSVNFTGISMGASLAGSTAEDLLARGLVTQERSDRDKPQLSLTSYEPVGRSDSPLHLLQVPAGFLKETVHQLRVNPDLKVIETGREQFAKNLREVMAARGIPAHRFAAYREDEQARYKREILGPFKRKLPSSPLVSDLVKGVPLSEEVKSNEIIGMKDPTLWSPTRNRQAREKRKLKSLGSSITPRAHENRRVFGGVKMSHSLAFYREGEMHRWDKAAEEILRLKKQKGL